MHASPLASKSIVFLLALLYLHANTADATISTSAGFPQDVFAKPAFRVNIGGTGRDAATLPIKRTDALKILEEQEASLTSAPPPNASGRSSSLAIPGHYTSTSHSNHGGHSGTLLWQLERSSPDNYQLCSIPNFTSKPASDHGHGFSGASPSRSRQDLIRNAQTLLEPLKKMCLYHTLDWFTYSFCHGREIRQFRQLSAQTAAQRAFKQAGGGDAGKEAAVEAAKKVQTVPYPVDDPVYPAYTLGRWSSANEDIVGDDRSHSRHQQQPLGGDGESGTSVSTQLGSPLPPDSGAMDLVEEVQFGDWDEEELFAAEAKALAQFGEEGSNAVEAAREGGGADAQRHRYLTQRWGNGTMCDMNHQPRTVEVQFHCSNRMPAEDRIVMSKETTICNYVLVIETPRLCADPAYGSEKEEAPLPIECHQVVDDNYPGPTVGEPDKVEHPSLTQQQREVEAKDGSARTDGATMGQSASDASTTSHTYGDLSRYGSIHDDYYDEALGGHGDLYGHYHEGHDHAHDHEHDHADVDTMDSPFVKKEVLVEIGMDENGQLLVNQIDDASLGAASADDSAVKRRSGKKRSDDDDADASEHQPMEIQLDIDDFLSVLSGGDGGSLESKLAEKISDALNKQLNKQQDDTEAEADEKRRRMKTPEDIAKLYERLMAGVTAGGAAAAERRQGQAAAPAAGAGKGNANTGQGKPSNKGKQGPALRMEKVGDSLSEKAKRFYEARERDEEDSNKKKKQGERDEGGSIAHDLEL